MLGGGRNGVAGRSTLVALSASALVLCALPTASGSGPPPAPAQSAAKKCKKAKRGVAAKRGKKCKRVRPNAAPLAVADVPRVGEDSGATVVAVLANDTDSDGGPKTIVSATDPANGSVAISGGGSGLTYAPDLNYCNDPGGSPDGFSYMLNGGSTASVSVTVGCVDDPPVAVPDTRTVNEDSTPTAVNVLANDYDVDGGPITIQSVADTANSTSVLSHPFTSLTYKPNINYCNDFLGGADDVVGYTINGGSSTTLSVKVVCEFGGGGRR